MTTYTQEEFEQALQHCEREPIHQLGLIQPHGVILALGNELPRTVLQASDNLSLLFDLAKPFTCGQALNLLLDSVSIKKIEQLIQDVKHDHAVSDQIQIIKNGQSQEIQARLFQSGSLYALELVNDENIPMTERAQDLLMLMQQGLAVSELDVEIPEYFEKIAELVQSLSGFHRVMVYRFDDNWDGEVIAESCAQNIDSFLGLHFPASDIPPQARRLYTLNHVRHVADIDATPVAISPSVNPQTGESFDMTYSSLRSFSPVHIEYLRHMGVHASMSISLLQNGRLWGLIACHHQTAKRVSNAVQETAALIGRMASVRLSSIEAQKQRKLINNAVGVIGELVKNITTDSVSVLMEKLLPDLLNPVNATGICVMVEGNLYSYANTPPTESITELLTWLKAQGRREVFSTHHLGQKFPPAENYAHTVSGLLATPLSSDMRNCIIWFRAEMPQTVKWAGDTQKSLHTDATGMVRLSPRQSFDAWTESRHAQSAPWSNTEEGIAGMLSIILTEGLSQKYQLERVLEQQKAVEDELRIAATAFESQEGIILTDSEGIIVRVNTAFTNITGYSADEVMGKTPRILKSGKHDSDFYQLMWKRLLTDGVWDGEIWNKRKNGTISPEHLTITAVKDAVGAIKNFVGSLIDLTQMKASQQEIEKLVYFDPLTGLPNRRLLIDRLKQAITSRTRSQNYAALLFIDLDNFKMLNDTLGHDYGDLLLQQVADRLAGCIRKSDVVARLGGDEFVVILEDLSKNQGRAVSVTERVTKKIIAVLTRPYSLLDQKYQSTPSIGVTLFNKHDVSFEDIIKQADIAMYQAKKAGSNTFRFFDPEMQAYIVARASLESGLRLAIAEKQFMLHYQLQINHDQKIIGAEVLIRWQHPQLGFLPPSKFIPLAEETGLIVPIGLWVLETVCSQLNSWQDNPLLNDLQIAINVCPKQFFQADFVAQVQRIITLYCIKPGRLKFELTENILVEQLEPTIEAMTALRKLGISFSLDDFGTGYSSLQYLKKLPLDQLKIDQSFVREIVIDTNDQAIIKTIIAMAKALDLDVIAEGVETQMQRELLEQYGCNTYQGYLFSKPIPVAEFVGMVTGLISWA